METKSQFELSRVGRYYTYTNKDTIAREITYEFHPLWYRIKMLYDLLKSKNGPCGFVKLILRDIKRYGIHHKVAKADLIAMNKMYNQYK
tara:strand:+ start:53 stop:319 length:267 start_codon:yes stop_codon:yes gene_type:complete